MVKFLQKLAQSSFEQVATGSYPAAAAAIGTARYLGHNVKHTINDTANKIERRPCTSTTRNAKGYYLGWKSYKNSVAYETIHFGLLGNAFGSCTTTGTSVLTHVLDELESTDLPPFNLEHVWDATVDEVRVYNGCTVDKYSLSCRHSEPLISTVDYAAAYCYKAGAKETLTEDTTNPYMWHESRLLFDITTGDGSYTSGVEQLNITDWTWSIANNLIAEPRCESTSGGANIVRPSATKRDYELTFTWDMDDDDFYDLLDAATECAYQVYVYRSATDYLKITIEEAQVVTAPDNMDGEGDLVPQTVTFKGGQIDATATNTQCLDAYGTSGGGEEYPADPA